MEMSMNTRATCPACGTFSPCITNKLRRGSGAVYRCESCDLGFLVSDGHTNYNGGYRDHASDRADGLPATPKEIFAAYVNTQQKRLDLVKPFLTPGCSVLEIGASAGQFISHLMGNHRVYALEPDKASVQHMIDIGITAMTDLPEMESYSFDAVCAFQMLEHTPDPVAALRMVRSLTKMGGHAIIEVPNLNDHLLTVWNNEAYREFYFHADHRWYFTAKSLEAACRTAGFQNVEIRFTQDYNLVNTMHWLVNNGPQETCRPGLAPIAFVGQQPIAAWLTDAITRIGDMYEGYLVQHGTTSNITAILS